MRVLLGTPFFAPYDQGRMILKALGEIGCCCVVWDYRINPKPPKGNFDLTILNKGEGVDPTLVESPKVVFWPDDWHYSWLPTIRKYDRVYTLMKPDQAWMNWLPGFADEHIHRKLDTEKKFDLAYIGTCRDLGIKAKFIVELAKRLPKRISFVIFGNGWEQVGIKAYPPQYFLNYSLTCNYARMLLVVHYHNHGVLPKAFEFTASGTPTLIDRVDGVDEIFSDDEVIKYEHGNVQDCLEKICYYLENLSKAENIARQGRVKVYSKYTYKHQFSSLVEDFK